MNFRIADTITASLALFIDDTRRPPVC